MAILRNLWQESQSAYALKKDLLASEINPFSFSSDHLDLKDPLLSCCWWGKPRVRLGVRWLILPPVDLQTHFSLHCSTERTIFHVAANGERMFCSLIPSHVCSFVAWYLAMSAASEPTPVKNADFWLINHWKRLAEFNALFGRRSFFLVVQEDISWLQSSRTKLKKKVEIWKISLSLCFLPSIIPLQTRRRQWTKRRIEERKQWSQISKPKYQQRLKLKTK